jgi:hypothetical protein
MFAMLSRIISLVALVAVLPGLLAAQAAAEAAIGSAKAAVSTAPAAQAAGEVLGTGLSKLGQVFHETVGSTPTPQAPGRTPAKRTVTTPGAKRAVARRQSQPAAAEPAQPAPPAVAYEDPAAIKEGMEYSEVIRRFGPPAMKFTSGPGEEMLSYAKNEQSVDVQMRNGKVTSVHRIGGSDPAPAPQLP